MISRIASVVLLVACAAVVSPVEAQDFPNRPVHVVVPFAAGGGGDIVVRSVTTRLSEQLGQSFIVENKVGAGGNIGAEGVARSKPDGYTLLEGGDHLTLSKALYKNLGYDTFKDLIPVAGLSVGPHVLLAHPSLEANNLAELIALAKAKPGTITIATPGIGTAQDLFAALLKSSAGIDVVTASALSLPLLM